MTRLERYLAFRVLGVTQFPRRRRRLWNGKGPARDYRYRAFVRSLPCLVCSGACGPSEAAHTGFDGGMRLKASDFTCVPLCAWDHTLAPDSYHEHKGGRAGFERQFKLDLAAQVRFLNQEWRESRC